MREKPKHRAALPWTLLLTLALGGCTIHKVEEHPAPPIQAAPSFSPTTGTSPGPDRWWQGFASPGLTDLVEGALRGNLELHATWARLEQVEALTRRAGAALLPSLTLDAGAGKSKRVSTIGSTKLITRDKSFSLSLGAAYEVDLWGRLAALEKSQLLEYRATRLDLEALAMTLATQVTDTWFAIITERALARLLREQLATGRTFLELVELRFANGQASAVDVYQQRQQLAATRSQLPLSDSRLQVLHHKLALLQGRDPVVYVAPEANSLPALPPLPAPGLPADLLSRRPDIAAARARVTGADHSLGVAIADRLPALRLSGSTGYQASKLKDLFDDWIWNLAAGLTAPLFDGGRREADKEAAQAVLKSRTAQLGQVFLKAVAEVEDALVQERRQGDYLAALNRQLEITRSTLRESRVRYSNGLSDYLPVLTALQAVQVRERDRLSARRQLLAYRVQLHRALGGGWTGALENPTSARQGKDK